MDDPEGRPRVARLVAEARQALQADPGFRTEISRWIEDRYSEAHERDSEARHRLGLPLTGATGHTPELPARPDLFAPMAAGVARTLGGATGHADDDTAAEGDTPLLALLSTKADRPADWLAAGQALQHVLLIAAMAGVSASYLSPALELTRFRTQVGKAFGARGSAQVLLGLGYGPAGQPTARRPVREIVA